MLGLIATFNDGPAIRCGLPGDGVITVGVHAMQRKGETTREAVVEAGGLDAGSNQLGKWLLEALRPGDELEVLLAEVQTPDPWVVDAALPDTDPEAAMGIELFKNGVLLGRLTVQQQTVVLAMVTWIKGTRDDPGGDVQVCVDLHPHLSDELSLGDRVLFRMI